MDRLLPLQKSVNSIESAITNVALQFAAPSFVLDKTKGVNPEGLCRSYRCTWNSIISSRKSKRCRSTFNTKQC